MTTSRSDWVELKRRYTTSMGIALSAWRNLLEGAVPDDATLQAATATLFIQASKMGLRGLVTTKTEKTHTPIGGYDTVPDALKDKEDDGLPW
jgi:hypothetical protein